MTWRDRARPVVARVLAETKGQEERAVRAALREAYPFGPKEYHPYKIWLSEIAVQMGKRKLRHPRRVKDREKHEPDPRQLLLIPDRFPC